jgi:hypothetical protein
LGRRLGALLWLLSFAWGVSPAQAIVRQCVAGGTIAAPLDFSDPSTWSPAGVPDATTDLQLAQPCAVRCTSSSCAAHTLKGTNAAASFEVAPGAALVLSGCDTASAYAQSTYQCGAENGFRFAPQGAVVHDSLVEGDAILRGSSLPAQPDHLRFALANAIDVAVGDWLQIRSGPSRSQVYRVVGLDLSGCPANPASCWFEVALHDPSMEFGQNPQTVGYATGVGYLAPGTMRIAAPDQPGYAANDLAHCVEICTSRLAGNCIDATTLARDESYVGWYLGASDASLDPASAAVMSRRALIVESHNFSPETIGGAGQVDRVCFADPIPPEWVPATGYAERSAVVWPGFWPGDAWVLFRPATVRYAGAEGDGGLGFHGACVDADFAYFDGWAKIATRDGTPACQQPYQDTVIVSWAHGLPGVPVDQQSACNGHSLDVIGYGALSGDRVALVDTRTHINASGSCYAGLDPAPDSGFHGLALANSVFDPLAPPAEWLVRYAGDDGIYIGAAGSRRDHVPPAALDLVVERDRRVHRGRRLPVLRSGAEGPLRGRARRDVSELVRLQGRDRRSQRQRHLRDRRHAVRRSGPRGSRARARRAERNAARRRGPARVRRRHRGVSRAARREPPQLLAHRLEPADRLPGAAARGRLLRVARRRRDRRDPRIGAAGCVGHAA